MTPLDLLGAPIAPPLTGKRKPTKPKGYAALPGTGPKGETCKGCKHAHPIETPSRKRFWKCRLVKQTHGTGTDIRVRSPACSRFEKAEA